MIATMKPRANIDHECDEDNVPNANEASVDDIEEGSGTYYYDDATGYEVFSDEDDDNEETPS